MPREETFSPDGRYGSKISGMEYERRVVALHRDQPPHLSREEQVRLRRQELEITIDHRLGVDFPRDKRDALWSAQRSLDRKVLTGALLAILGPRFHSNWLARMLFRDYARVLSAEDMVAFFQDDEG